MRQKDREYYWIRSNILLRSSNDSSMEILSDRLSLGTRIDNAKAKAMANNSSSNNHSIDRSANERAKSKSFDPKSFSPKITDRRSTSQSSPFAKLVQKRNLRAIIEQHWGWIRALVLSRSSTDNTAELLLYDDSSSSSGGGVPEQNNNVALHLKKVTIPVTYLQDEDVAVRVNSWAVAEMEAYLFVTPTDFIDIDDESTRQSSVGDLGYQYLPDDVTKLVHLHEPALVYALRKRFEANEIYTNTGQILLALNPFKDCQYLYGEDVMYRYMKKTDDTSFQNNDSLTTPLPPHVFEIADRAFHTMMRSVNDFNLSHYDRANVYSKADQCILVSGESGAGKTVSANHIMQYLAFMSQQHNSINPVSNKKSKETLREGADIEEQLLFSTHILESFGNARTTRNDNSSRFGKFTEIGFTSKGRLVGAAIETYLLEKVRILLQAPGERNYHVFYQILFGSTLNELDKFYLSEKSPEDFVMTSKSGTYDRRDGVSDIEMYEQLRTAINGMGFSSEEQSDIIGVCCAVLHLSNVTFLAVTDDHSQVDTSNPALDPMLSLLGLKVDNFNKALTTFSIEVGVAKEGEAKHFVRSLSRDKAAKGLEALLKATYAALFDFIVDRIRGIIKTSDKIDHIGPLSHIGVLDIFGFENFEKNSFEQLCINYCNETLQKQFNDFVLRYEQIEYAEEGIDWSYVTFPENQDVIDLIDRRGFGILEILNDQCISVGTTDKTFWHDMHTKCRDNSRFEASYLQIGSRKFEIRHYAGSVEYGTDTFLEKNLDELPREAAELLKSSNRPLVSSLAHFMRTNVEKSVTAKPRRRASLSTVSTVSAQFIQQLKALRHKIDSAAPHYIRCLKPNNGFVPDVFDNLLVANQLRYAGVIEAIRVSRAGFAQRFMIPSFVDRYDVLVAKRLLQEDHMTDREVCDLIINMIAKRIVLSRQEQSASDSLTEGSSHSIAANAGLQMGKTKVFVSSGAFKELESLRQQRFDDAAVVIQHSARGFVQRLRYKAAVRAVLVIQRHTRGFFSNLRLQEENRKFLAVTCLQKKTRGILARKKYSTFVSDREDREKQLRNDTAVMIQCSYRVYRAREILSVLRAREKDFEYILQERDSLRKEIIKLRRQLLEQGMFEYDNEELYMILREIKNQALQLESMIKSNSENQPSSKVTPSSAYPESALLVDLEPNKASKNNDSLMLLNYNTTTLLRKNSDLGAEIEKQKSNSLQKELDHLKSIAPSFHHDVDNETDARSIALEEYRRKLGALLSPSETTPRASEENDFSIVSSATVVRLVNRLEDLITNKRQPFENMEVMVHEKDNLEVDKYHRDLIKKARNRMNEKLFTLDETHSSVQFQDDISLDASALNSGSYAIPEQNVTKEKKSYWEKLACCSSGTRFFNLDETYFD